MAQIPTYLLKRFDRVSEDVASAQCLHAVSPWDRASDRSIGLAAGYDGASIRHQRKTPE
jgi:hypothetical protein